MTDPEDRGATPAELADLAEAEVMPNEGARAPRPRSGRLARSTAFFAIATGFSRVAGLVREIFAASYFGTSAQMSAFTIAFLIPNTVRSLFADAAIQAAFVPVFTEELERNRRREAFRLASTLIFLVGLVLGLITALFVLAAPLLVPIFAPGFNAATTELTVSLSRVLFPILVLLGISGMVVGVLNSYDRFSVFAIAPFFWNVAIVAVLVGLAPAFPEDDQIYAYAIGVVAGTVLQLAMLTYDLRNTPFGIRRAVLSPFQTRVASAFRDADVRRVLVLMLPVTISLGLININLLLNGLFGSLVSDQAPAAIDKAFRIYMLPQGIFSVAVSTVLFPTLARFAARGELDDLRATMANGMRQIVLLLVPAAAAILVLSEPMISSLRPSSGSPSRCRSTGCSCSSPGPSSASSGPGYRPRSRASTSRSRPSSRSPSTGPSGSAESSRRPRSRPRSASPRRPRSCGAPWAASSSAGSRGRASV
jgi:putative peptidoglycan lipid II flippase